MAWLTPSPPSLPSCLHSSIHPFFVPLSPSCSILLSYWIHFLINTRFSLVLPSGPILWSQRKSNHKPLNLSSLVLHVNANSTCRVTGISRYSHILSHPTPSSYLFEGNKSEKVFLFFIDPNIFNIHIHSTISGT